MTTQEKIEVMNAYTEEKKIQYRSKENGEWFDLFLMQEPAWDWASFDYRIKPEEKYRPYKDTDEMIEDFKRRFNVQVPPYAMPMIWVRDKGTNVRSHVSAFFAKNVTFRDATWWLDVLFENFTYLDGSPCGIREE